MNGAGNTIEHHHTSSAHLVISRQRVQKLRQHLPVQGLQVRAVSPEGQGQHGVRQRGPCVRIRARYKVQLKPVKVQERNVC
jgi:hypothetical protein